MKSLRFLIGLCTALLLASAAAQDFAPIPPLKSRVTDLSGMLQPEQQTALEKKLQAHEAKTGNQVAILLVKSTAPEVIEQYGIRVAEKWKIGRKGIDDGVILIIAKDNSRELRRMRLEVGRGAEGVLTDAKSKQILQDVIAPHFRKSDFAAGLNAGVDAIHAVLNKEAFSPPAHTRQTSRASAKYAQNDNLPGWALLLIMLLPFAFIITIVALLMRARSHGAGAWGTSSGIYIGGGGWSSGSSSDSGGSDFSGGGGDFGGGGSSGDW